MNEEINVDLSRIFKSIQKTTVPINHFMKSSAFQNIIEQHNMMSRVMDNFINSSSFKSIIEQQSFIAKSINDLTKSSVFQNILEQQSFITKSINDLTESSIFQSMMKEPSLITRMLAEIPNSQFLKDIDFDNIQLDSEEFKSIIEEQDAKISDDEQTFITDFLEVSAVAFPEINDITRYFEDKNYTKSAIALIRFIIIYSILSYQMYSQFINADAHYKVNRDNVRVRLTPIKEDNENVIIKLNKNTYVEKIGSDNAWIKVNFELDDGIEKEGWIYRTMLTKID